MTFGAKLRKLRTENNLTQDELAEKLFVTRTAISKWETDKGFPSIDSLKQISDVFGMTIDELISDEDIENNKLLEAARAKKMYALAMVFLAVTVAAALCAYFLEMPYINYVGTLSMSAYIICAFNSKPKHRKMKGKEYIVPYIISRLVVLAVVVSVIIWGFFG